MNPCAGSAIRKKIKSDITPDVAISFIFMFLKLFEKCNTYLTIVYTYIYTETSVPVFKCVKNELMRVYTIVNK